MVDLVIDSVVFRIPPSLKSTLEYSSFSIFSSDKCISNTTLVPSLRYTYQNIHLRAIAGWSKVNKKGITKRKFILPDFFFQSSKIILLKFSAANSVNRKKEVLGKLDIHFSFLTLKKAGLIQKFWKWNICIIACFNWFCSGAMVQTRSKIKSLKYWEK